MCALITRTYGASTANPVAAGSTILAAHVNTDLDTAYAAINGNIEDANIKASANIAISKTTLTYTAPTSVASTVWKGIGSDPAIGNGTWSASYIQVGKLLYFTFSMIAGSTTTFGTGSWFINLPISNVLTTSVPILLFDNSTSSSYRALAAISGGQIYPWYYADGSTQTVTVTAPFSWAVNDYFTATAIYHVA